MAVATSTVVAGAIIGAGAISAGMQVIGANKQAKAIRSQGEYNAQVYEQQASMIEHKKRLQEEQDNREAARVRGATKARAAGAGITMSGSPLAILVDNETQLALDSAIGQYNLEVDRRMAMSGAGFSRYSANQNAGLAKSRGYTNAFSTILNSAVSAYSVSGFKPKTTPKAGKL